MWIFLNDAFFSIVSKDCGRDELLVRARRKGDIEKVFPGAKVTSGSFTDYRFRARIKRDEIVRALDGEVRRITYSNFKNSVTAKADDGLHEAYSTVWAVMAAQQETPPYGGGFFADAYKPFLKKKPRKRRKRARKLRSGQ